MCLSSPTSLNQSTENRQTTLRVGPLILAEAPTNKWLPVRMVFDICGMGLWQIDTSICVPSAEDLQKIRERRESFALLGIGARAETRRVEAMPANLAALRGMRIT